MFACHFDNNVEKTILTNINRNKLVIRQVALHTFPNDTLK